MAGVLKVDSINADSNLTLKIANTAVAFIDATGLRPTSGNVNLDATATSKFYLPSANTVAIQTAGVTAVTINSTQAIGVGSSPSFGTNGQLLTSSGSGAAPTWTTVSVPSAATPTALGTVYGKMDASSVAFVGYNAGLNNTGLYNTALGFDALKTNTSTGQQITAIGWTSGQNATGTRGTFVGAQSGTASTGVDNTGIGNQSLQNNTSGTNNTSCGAYALGVQTTASNNTGVGFNAGIGATSGGQNTYIGRGAGGSHATGDGCTYVGYEARASTTSVGNEFVFGFNCVGNGGASATIGDAVGQIYVQYRGTATWNQVSDIRLKKNITPDTLGLSFIQRLNPVTYQWKASNELDEDNPYYAEVNARDTEDVMHGLIAQEVKEALDAEGVTTFDGWKTAQNGMQAISHTMFVTPLIKAVQELKSLNDTQAATIAALTARMVAVESK